MIGRFLKGHCKSSMALTKSHFLIETDKTLSNELVSLGTGFHKERVEGGSVKYGLEWQIVTII